MNPQEQAYLNLMKDILETGNKKSDRTGIGTLSKFGMTLRFSLENNTLPLLTTKKMFVRGVIEELLFFLRGDTDTKKLEAKGVNIWKGNTSREFLDSRGLNYLPEGHMGKGYGFNWRHFGAEWGLDDLKIDRDNNGTDQIANVIHSIKNDPDSRRHIVSAWNPNQLHQVALPSCHNFFQFYVNGEELSCQFNMRSTDTFLGLPYNLASYAILTHIIAKATNKKAKELIFVGNDTHLYLNHIDQVKEQISREPFPFPQLEIKKEISTIQDIENLCFEDFEIKNYKCHPSIMAEMAI